MSKRYNNLIGIHNEICNELKHKGFYINHKLSPKRYILTQNNKDIYISKTLKDIDIYIDKMLKKDL